MKTRYENTGVSQRPKNIAPGPMSLLVLLVPFAVTGLTMWAVAF